MSNLNWDALSGALKPKFLPSFGCPDSIAFALPAYSALHFLDHHAIKLAGRLDRRMRLRFDNLPAEHLVARLEADCFPRDEASIGQLVPYSPGIILQWVRCAISPMRVAPVWRDYLTSLDREFRVQAGKTLDAAYPHLRLGIVTGVDLFNSGEFYAAHEDWESLWMRLDDGPEKSVLQGLIQLCGAHIHRLKGREEPCRTMWEKTRANLERGLGEIHWLDIPKLVEATETVIGTPLCDHIALPEIPLVNQHADVPRKHR
jgi:hypothetical protein